MRRSFYTLAICLLHTLLMAQSSTQQRVFDFQWKENSEKWNPEQLQWFDWPVFEKAAFDQNWHALPYRRFKIAVPHQVTDLEIVDESFENRSLANWAVQREIEGVRWANATENKQKFLLVDIVPFDPVNGRILKSFKLKYTHRSTPQKAQKSMGFATQSVLANGQWYKMSVETDGMYRITPSYLQSNGLDGSNLSIQSIRVFGNGGGMLPEENADPWIDDLKELSIEIMDENSNGLFDGNDQILFTRQGRIAGPQMAMSSVTSLIYTPAEPFTSSMWGRWLHRSYRKQRPSQIQVRSRQPLLMTVNFLKRISTKWWIRENNGSVKNSSIHCPITMDSTFPI